jgi:hypothetical protein
MNYNKYNEVINGTETYKGIATGLLDNKTIGIGWTDEDSTHLDIIFKLGLNMKCGCFQRGIKANYLFVSIIDHTSYGFVPDSIKDGSYIQEKLRINNNCAEMLALGIGLWLDGGSNENN